MAAEQQTKPPRRDALDLIKAETLVALHGIVMNEQADDADRIEAARLLLTIRISEARE